MAKRKKKVGGGAFLLKARPMGLLALHDPASFNQLADDLEAEAFHETTRKLMERSR
jgi:hypothetical protein